MRPNKIFDKQRHAIINDELLSTLQEVLREKHQAVQPQPPLTASSGAISWSTGPTHRGRVYSVGILHFYSRKRQWLTPSPYRPPSRVPRPNRKTPQLTSAEDMRRKSMGQGGDLYQSYAYTTGSLAPNPDQTTQGFPAQSAAQRGDQYFQYQDRPYALTGFEMNPFQTAQRASHGQGTAPGGYQNHHHEAAGDAPYFPPNASPALQGGSATPRIDGNVQATMQMAQGFVGHHDQTNIRRMNAVSDHQYQQQVNPASMIQTNSFQTQPSVPTGYQMSPAPGYPPPQTNMLPAGQGYGNTFSPHAQVFGGGFQVPQQHLPAPNQATPNPSNPMSMDLREALAYVFSPPKEVCIQLQVIKDDQHLVGGPWKALYVSRLFSALTAPWGPPSPEWTVGLANWYHTSMDATLTSLRDKLSKAHFRSRAQAFCLIAIHHAVNVHANGIPIDVADAAHSKNFNKEFHNGIKCSQRVEKMIQFVRENKSVARDLAHGVSLEELVRSPARCLKKKLANTSDNHRKKVRKEDMEKAMAIASGAQPAGQVAVHSGHVGYADGNQMQPEASSNQADSGDSKGKRKAGYDDEDAASSGEPAKKRPCGDGTDPSISNVPSGNGAGGSLSSILPAAGLMYGNADPGYMHSPYAPDGSMQPIAPPPTGAPSHPQTLSAEAVPLPPQDMAPQAQLQQHRNRGFGAGYAAYPYGTAANNVENASLNQHGLTTNATSPDEKDVERKILELGAHLHTPADHGMAQQSGGVSSAASQDSNGYAGADVPGTGSHVMGVVGEAEEDTEPTDEDRSPQSSGAEATDGSGSSLNSAAIDEFGDYFDFSGYSESKI